MTEEQLMAKIRGEMGPAIRAGVAGSNFSEAFVAGLVANESGGDMAAKHLDCSIFCDLAQVLAGRKPAFDSLGAQDLTAILTKAGLSGNPLQSVTNALFDLATSWGATQIEGYHTVKWGVPLSALRDPAQHFNVTVRLLEDFRRLWRLPVIASTVPTAPIAGDYLPYCEYLRCWNTGHPTGETEDPQYVAKGLARMALYAALP